MADTPTGGVSIQQRHDNSGLVPLSIDPNSPRSSLRCEEDDSLINEDSESAEAKLAPQRLSQDRLRFLFGIMGMATLFPYNALVTSVDYFAALHPEERDVAGQVAASTITALLVSSAAILPLSTPGKGLERRGGGVGCCLGFFASPARRVLIGFVSCLILLPIIPAAPEPSMAQLNAFSFLVGVADAISQSGLYVFAASYRVPSYSAAVAFGSAISGLAVSALRLITRGVFDASRLEGLRDGVSLLFALSAAVMAICIYALVAAVKDRGAGWGDVDPLGSKGEARLLGESQMHEECDAAERDDAPLNERSPVLSGKRCLQSKTMDKSQTKKKKAQGRDAVLSGEDGLDKAYLECKEENCGVEMGVELLHHPRLRVYMQTLQITWKPVASAFLNFFITLSLFPGIITSIQSITEEGGKSGVRFGNWLPVVLITTFNAADVVGRAVLNIECLGLSKRLLEQHELDNSGTVLVIPGHKVLLNFDSMVWFQTLARLGFYPIFALCLLPSPSSPLIASDLMRVLIVFFFGFTNGFINCACFMAAPSMAIERQMRDAASLLVLLAVYLGLTGGVYFGLGVDAILVPPNSMGE